MAPNSVLNHTAERDYSPCSTDYSDGFDLNDALKDDPTKPPSTDDFDLSDALSGDPIKPAAGSSFDDSDLQDVVNSDYKPEKTKSKAQDPPTVIDIIIDLVMALIGGTSEQVKKLCFSLLEMFTEQYVNVQDQ
ncbi:CD99 antigen-like protein 2 [Rhincodon typus]|uniref:CD99 antigen-like protein 2 n=1 Tax=Rhincodon typus TaxID=259920 RepID=UPI00202DD5D1|nr:CD99 antigen-like protein 2 [Rhincodon typus]